MVESWYDKKERCGKISIFYKIARNCAILKKEKPEGGNDMEQFNILVCDDDKSIVDAIEIYLKQEGYHVIKAYNGLEALKALEENEVHLILLDIMLPDIDGFEVCRRIRATSKQMGRKDIIKVDAFIDLTALGYIDPNITINVIKDGERVEKYHPELPAKVINVVRCKNPRCITTVEQELPHVFKLTDTEKRVYRCIYCETKAN